MNKFDTRWLALAIFLAAILLRFVPHWPNFSPVAAMALFVGCYLSSASGLVLAIGAMAISDFVGQRLGIPGITFYSTTTMITVYVALALTAIVGRLLRSRVNAATVSLGAITGTVLFFLSTNFACWLDPIMGYPTTAAGLVQCYVAAIPFAANSLLGDLFYSGLMFGGYAWMTRGLVQSNATEPAMATRR